MTLKAATVIENKLTVEQQDEMTNDVNLSEALSNKSAAREWPQIIAILTASLSAITMGLLFAWPSPSIPVLISSSFPGNITLSQASYLTVLPPITATLTSPIFAILTDRLGRKPCLLIFTTGPHLASWCLIAFTPQIEWLYVSRLLAGIADSCVFAVLPMYIGEVATPKVRGTWGNAMTVNILVGQFMVNAVGAFLSIKLTALILAVVPILFLCTFSRMPESPYYLIMTGQNSRALLSLKWLRNDQSADNACTHNVEEEFEQLTKDVARQLSEPGRFKDLFLISSNRRALFVGAVARLCQQYCGISAFATYTKYLFEVAGGNIDTTVSSLVFTGALIICSFASSAVLDRLGRMKAMITSSLTAAISLASLSVFLYLKDHSTVNLSAISDFFPIAGMIAYVLSISIGIVIVPNMLLGEIFSSSVKGKALCVMNICFAVYIGTSTKLFQVLMDTYGLYVPFAFHATCCLASSFVSYYIIPDTTGKTLEEIQQNFKNHHTKNRCKTKPQNSHGIVNNSYRTDSSYY